MVVSELPIESLFAKREGEVRKRALDAAFPVEHFRQKGMTEPEPTA
jgi:hypothetical protein